MNVPLLLALCATAGSLASTVCRRADETRLSVIAGVTVLWVVLATAMFGRLLHSLEWSAIATTLVSAGLLIALRRFPRVERKPFTIPRVHGVAIVVSFVAFLAVCWTAVVGHYFDEEAAHFAVTSSMALGVLPPEHPLFPGHPWRYHYAFQMLSALVHGLLGIKVEYAIDVVTIMSCILLFSGWADVGAAMSSAGAVAQKRAASLAMLLVPLGASPLLYFATRGFGDLEWTWAAVPEAWVHETVPATVINFFQHPMGLGLSLAPAPLLLFADSLTTKKHVIGAFAMLTLSLCNFVVFVVVGFGLGVLAVLRARPRFGFSGLLEVILLLGALGGSFLLGGMAGTDLGDDVIFGQSYFTGSGREKVMHHLLVFGMGLIALVPFAVSTLRGREPIRIAVLSAVLFGLAVPNLAVYRRSWDIVKFFMVAGPFLHLTLADSLARLRAPHFGKLVTAMVIIETAYSWLWFSRTTVLNGKYGMHYWVEGKPADDALRLVRHLPQSFDPWDRVFSIDRTLSYVGLRIPGFGADDSNSASYIMSMEPLRQERDAAARARNTMSCEDLAILKVRWIALRKSEFARLGASARAALEDRETFQPTTPLPSDEWQLFDVRCAYAPLRN